MELLSLLVPFAAAGGWLWWIHQADRLEREPWPLVFKTFGLAAGAGLSSLIALFILMLLLPEEEALATGLLLLVPVHVLAMTGVIYGLPYRDPAWNEPFDGLVYGGAAGIGYGLTYSLMALLEGPLTGFRTALFSIPTFMLVGLIIGHYLSQVRFGPPRRRLAMWLRALFLSGLALAGIEWARGLGGTVMGTGNPVASAFVYGANTVGWILAMWAMDAKDRSSQFNPGNHLITLAAAGCPTCDAPPVMGAAFCHQCGQHLDRPRGGHLR